MSTDYKGIRDGDGLTLSENLAIAKKAVVGKRRWDLSERGRQDLVDLAEGTVADEGMATMVRLTAGKLMLEMEAMNQKDERAVAESGGRGEPQVILVLPSNGTEVGRGKEGGEERGGLFDEDGEGESEDEDEDLGEMEIEDEVD